MKIDLKFPVELANPNGSVSKLKSVNIPDRWKARHIKHFPKGMVNGGTEAEPHEIVPFIAGITGLPQVTVEEIDFIDITKIMEEIGNFLADYLLGSGKPESASGQ